MAPFDADAVMRATTSLAPIPTSRLRPHHAGQFTVALRQVEPPRTVGRAEPAALFGYAVGWPVAYAATPMVLEQRNRYGGVAVIADLVSTRRHFARNFRQAIHVGAARKMAGILCPARMSRISGAFAGAIVKGEGQRASVARPMPYRAPEDGCRTPADGPRHTKTPQRRRGVGAGRS
jgi:hypothetical protein